MQVLLLPLLIIRMILSIFMSISTLSFLSRTERRIQQAHAPGQVQRPASNAMTSKTLVLVLAIVGVFMVAAFLANQAQSNAAPQPTQSTGAATVSPCQVMKHSKAHQRHHSHPACSTS